MPGAQLGVIGAEQLLAHDIGDVAGHQVDVGHQRAGRHRRRADLQGFERALNLCVAHQGHDAKVDGPVNRIAQRLPEM